MKRRGAAKQACMGMPGSGSVGTGVVWPGEAWPVLVTSGVERQGVRRVRPGRERIGKVWTGLARQGPVGATQMIDMNETTVRELIRENARLRAIESRGTVTTTANDFQPSPQPIAEYADARINLMRDELESARLERDAARAQGVQHRQDCIDAERRLDAAYEERDALRLELETLEKKHATPPQALGLAPHIVLQLRELSRLVSLDFDPRFLNVTTESDLDCLMACALGIEWSLDHRPKASALRALLVELSNVKQAFANAKAPK